MYITDTLSDKKNGSIDNLLRMTSGIQVSP
jgi:hypothetical protein